MGKRRTDLDHKTKYDVDDDDDESDVEEEQEEPLKPDQISKIKSRKKLVARRRVPGSDPIENSNSVFSNPLNGSSSITTPVFSGFKGFTAFKPTNLTQQTSLSANQTSESSSLFSSTASKTVTATPNSVSSTESMFSSSSSLFGNKAQTNSIQKPTTTTAESVDSQTAKAKSDSVDLFSSSNNSSNKNISETELSFINDLNNLYEKYYGKNKRCYKLPVDAVVDLENEVVEIKKTLTNENGEKINESEKKYAYLLAELNRHCSKWISKHVEQNPLVILTPVFVDYFNYLILLEKDFFPATFKESSSLINGKNENSLFKSTSTNGNTGGLATTEPIMSFNAPSSLQFASDLENKQKNHVNGHKETSGIKLNGFYEKESNSQIDKENKDEISVQEVDSEKNGSLIESSKKFSNIFKSQTAVTGTAPQQFNPISLNTTNSTSQSFFSKAGQEIESKSKTDEKQSAPQESLFKFGASSNTSLLFGANTNSVAPPKTDLFSSKTQESSKSTENSQQPQLKFGSGFFGSGSAAPSFKFGSTVESGNEKTSTTETTKSNEKDTTESTTATKISIFSSMINSKPQEMTATTTSEQTGSTTFSSLLNNQSSSETSIFKPFQSTTSGASSSIFASSTIGATGTAASTKTPAPFFSFQSSLGGSTQSSLFGSTFGKSDTTGTTTSIFGSSTSLGTAGFAVSNNGTENGDGDEEEYVPPKPESSDIKEDGSVYTKRIKLYYFNEKEFCDRGIGNLFLKPSKTDDSYQLIIRADTSLGNILLNVKLNKLLPINKVGPKDVTFVCVPNPPIPNMNPKVPCKFLFKVKTEDDAKELLDKLNELKK